MSSLQCNAINTAGILAITPASTFNLLTNVSGNINIGTTGTQTTLVNSKLTSTGLLTASAGLTIPSALKLTCNTIESTGVGQAGSLFTNITTGSVGISIGTATCKGIDLAAKLITIGNGSAGQGLDVGISGTLYLGNYRSNNVFIGTSVGATTINNALTSTGLILANAGLTVSSGATQTQALTATGLTVSSSGTTTLGTGTFQCNAPITIGYSSLTNALSVIGGYIAPSYIGTGTFSTAGNPIIYGTYNITTIGIYMMTATGTMATGASLAYYQSAQIVNSTDSTNIAMYVENNSGETQSNTTEAFNVSGIYRQSVTTSKKIDFQLATAYGGGAILATGTNYNFTIVRIG